MSTTDVPGANPANRDELGVGSWAEHADGSLIFVESTEGDRVVYSMFDVSAEPVMTAAARVAERLGLKGRRRGRGDLDHMVDLRRDAESLISRIQRAIDRLPS